MLLGLWHTFLLVLFLAPAALIAFLFGISFILAWPGMTANQRERAVSRFASVALLFAAALCIAAHWGVNAMLIIFLPAVIVGALFVVIAFPVALSMLAARADETMDNVNRAAQKINKYGPPD